MTMKTSLGFWGWLGLGVAVAGFGCSAKVVDLGGAGNSTRPVYATTTPPLDAGGGTATSFRIVDGEQLQCATYIEPIDMFTVSSGRLYWISEQMHGDTYDLQLKNCSVDGCASSFVNSSTFEGQNGCGSLGGYIQVEGNTIFWNTDDALYTQIWTTSTAPGAKVGALGLPSRLQGSFQISDGVAYATTNESTIMRCDIANCGGTAQRMAMTAPAGEAPYSGQGVIFGQDSSMLYVFDSPRILRVAKNVNAVFEVLGQLSNVRRGSMVVHGDMIYWAEEVALGRVMACPTSDCGAPITLVSGLNYPTAVAIDDDSLYVVEPTYSHLSDDPYRSGARVLKCPATGCDNPAVLYETASERLGRDLVVDDHLVYFRGNDCTAADQDPNGGWWNGCGFIAAIPK